MNIFAVILTVTTVTLELPSSHLCVVSIQKSQFCMETDFGSEYGVSFNIPYLYKLKVLDFRKRVHLTFQSPEVATHTIRPKIQQFQISDQTATNSLYSINRLVFITETECVISGVCSDANEIFLLGFYTA
jgi:hypothetical protein